MSKMITSVQKDISLLYPDLTAAQIKVARLLAANVSPAVAASSTGVSPSVLSKWLTEDDFCSAVEYVSRTSNTLAELQNEALVLSWMLIVDALSKNINDAPNSSKVEMLKIARSIAGQQMAQPTGNTNVGTVQMYVSGGSVDAIARRVSELQSAIPDTPVSDINNEYNIVDVDAQYSVHPETDIGTINFDEETGKYQCHVCGKWFIDLTDHAAAAHGLKRDKYNELFGVL